MSRKKTTKEFLEQAQEVHGDKYDYSEVEFVNMTTKVCIICPDHGAFWQTPNAHISLRCNCPECVNEENSWTLQTLQQKSNEIHDSKYTILNIPKNAKSYVDIQCDCGNVFKQTPNDHINNKSGCPACGNKKTASKVPGQYNKKYFERNPEEWYKPAILYLVKKLIENEEHLKIGITEKTVRKRMGSNYETLKEMPMALGQAFEIEQEVLNDETLIKKKPEGKFDGKSECFNPSEEDKLIFLLEDKLCQHFE